MELGTTLPCCPVLPYPPLSIFATELYAPRLAARTARSWARCELHVDVVDDNNTEVSLSSGKPASIRAVGTEYWYRLVKAGPTCSYLDFQVTYLACCEQADKPALRTPETVCVEVVVSVPEPSCGAQGLAWKPAPLRDIFDEVELPVYAQATEPGDIEDCLPCCDYHDFRFEEALIEGGSVESWFEKSIPF